MKRYKVIKLDADSIEFEHGVTLCSDHMSDCCEHHWLCFKDLTIEDFDGLEFDLSSDSFFKRVPDFGIELLPIKGFPVRVPGYGSNNGYYSSHLDLCITGDGLDNTFDITECQDY